MTRPSVSQERGKLTRAAGVVGSATLASRILGFVRDMVIAYFFGAASSADAFFVAFRLPNLLRRLFAEGAFTVAFVPVFTAEIERHGKERALVTARSILTALALALLGISVLGVLFAPGIVRVVAPGFSGDPRKLELTVHLTRIVFPYLFFIGLVAGCMGVLNSFRHFLGPALAPALLNVSMITSVLFLSPFFEHPVYALAWGVVGGGAAQLLFQVPFMRAHGFRFRPSFRFRNPALMQILSLMAPAALGAAVYQINILVGTLLASLLPAGSVSYLYYADRVVQFPLGVFAIAIGTASLPSFSKFAAVGDLEGLSETLSHSLRLVLFVAIPSMAGLIVLRHPIVRVLFQRGAFDQGVALRTATALMYYALGLWAFSALKIVLAAFYALQDTATPVKVAVGALLANIGLSIVLMRPMQHNGLALATTISTTLNLLLLGALLRKKGIRLGTPGLVRSLARTLGACGFMVVVLEMAGAVLPVRNACVRLGTGLLLGGAAYLGTACLLGSEEFSTLWKPILSRVRRVF